MKILTANVGSRTWDCNLYSSVSQPRLVSARVSMVLVDFVFTLASFLFVATFPNDFAYPLCLSMCSYFDPFVCLDGTKSRSQWDGRMKTVALLVLQQEWFNMKVKLLGSHSLDWVILLLWHYSCTSDENLSCLTCFSSVRMAINIQFVWSWSSTSHLPKWSFCKQLLRG